jgi:hypothetical protein
MAANAMANMGSNFFMESPIQGRNRHGTGVIFAEVMRGLESGSSSQFSVTSVVGARHERA